MKLDGRELVLDTRLRGRFQDPNPYHHDGDALGGDRSPVRELFAQQLLDGHACLC